MVKEATKRLVHFVRSNIIALASVAVMQFAVAGEEPARSQSPETLLIVAHKLFDGVQFKGDQAVLLQGAVIADIGPLERLKGRATKIIDLKDATVLPGFIELHAHSLIRGVPDDIILRHGVTTLRDVGGPLAPMSGESESSDC